MYDEVRKGTGDVDTLNDVVTMAAFIRNHEKLAGQVRPGGKSADTAHLNQAKKNALHLLKLRGVALASNDDPKDEVKRKNQLLTLCILAQREIKLFAEMAFYENMDHYDQFYASDTLRKQRNNQSENDAPPEGQEV